MATSATQDDENLTEHFAFRMSAEQRERWERAAARDRRTLSDWARLTLDDAAAATLKKGRG